MSLFALLGTIACANRSGSKAQPVGPVGPTVVLHPPGMAALSVPVELARTPAEQQRGLMYRDKLDPQKGMLFLFPAEQQQVFWMKNTLIPLDIIFITAQRTVLGVAENAEPLTTSPRSVPGMSQYVLEVVGGFAKQHRISPGTPVEFVNLN
jgi:uncharacterized membrane protein (UPF0127 family)